MERSFDQESDMKCAAVTPDGRRLLAGCRDGKIRVWDLAAGALTGTIEAHTGFVQSLAVSPDGRRFAGGSIDGTLFLWDTERLSKPRRSR